MFLASCCIFVDFAIRAANLPRGKRLLHSADFTAHGKTGCRSFYYAHLDQMCCTVSEDFFTLRSEIDKFCSRNYIEVNRSEPRVTYKSKRRGSFKNAGWQCFPAVFQRQVAANYSHSWRCAREPYIETNICVNKKNIAPYIQCWLHHYLQGGFR